MLNTWKYVTNESDLWDHHDSNDNNISPSIGGQVGQDTEPFITCQYDAGHFTGTYQYTVSIQHSTLYRSVYIAYDHWQQSI